MAKVKYVGNYGEVKVHLNSGLIHKVKRNEIIEVSDNDLKGLTNQSMWEMIEDKEEKTETLRKKKSKQEDK